MIEQRRWWQARGFQVSAGFLTVIVLLGAGVMLTGGHSTPTTVAAPRPLARPASARPDTACHVPAGDQTIPLKPPPAHWDPVGDYQVPGQSKVGPARVTGHARYCWAHTPTGAVMAAYTDVALMDTWNTDLGMLRLITASGGARDEMLRQGGTTRSDPTRTAQVIAFRVLDYSPVAATVRLAVRVATRPGAQVLEPVSQIVALDIRMRWEQADWRIVVDPTLKAERLDSASELVFWGRP